MTRIALALALAMGVAAAAVEAHHSHTDFALDRDVTVSGTIEGIQFQNPHVLIRVRISGSTFYTAEWQSAGWLQAHPELVSPAGSVTSTTLKPGDRVVIVGSPPRDSALRSLVNLKEVRRPSDGWVWKCRGSAMPAAC